VDAIQSGSAKQFKYVGADGAAHDYLDHPPASLAHRLGMHLRPAHPPGGVPSPDARYSQHQVGRHRVRVKCRKVKERETNVKVSKVELATSRNRQPAVAIQSG